VSKSVQVSIVNFKSGSYIIVEGKQKADYFYIIRTGKVRISKEVELVREESGNILGPGDFLGVVSTMSSHSHIETAKALTDVSLISVHRDNYGDLIERNTPVAMKIIEKFSRRMRYLDGVLSRLTFKNEAEGESLEHIYSVAEYYAKKNLHNLAYYAYYQYLKYLPEGANFDKARERILKIAPYAKAVYLDSDVEAFSRQYPQNTMIFCENQPGQELYIIQKGSVKIAKVIDNNEVLLAVLRHGDIFGEMSLLENKPRSASAIAFEDSEIFAVNQENFSRMVKVQPQIIARLTTLLSERIWFIYKQLANTQISDPLGKLYDFLLIQLEKLRIPLVGGDSYRFDFGPNELIGMVGLPIDKGNIAVKKLIQNSKIKIVDRKICITNLLEVDKQAKYYRKMQKIENARTTQKGIH
jgi:CRP-like cAMP-binding protein